MNIADVTALVNQVQGRPVTIFVSAPGCPVIVLGHCVGHIQVDDGLFQIVKICFVRKLRIVIANDYQVLVFVLVVPFPQRGNYVPAINSTKGPHIDGNNLTSQVSQPQRGVHIQPDFVG
jgi:hypothetical protein